jgi:predicted nucleic acid-binding protein
MRNKLEAEAKLYVQGLIQSGEHELVWSYILEFENNDNPHEDRKQSTLGWKDVAAVKCDLNQAIESRAEAFQSAGFRSKDSLHIACAIEAEADYLLTTDDGLLTKQVEGIELINPIDFVRKETKP